MVSPVASSRSRKSSLSTNARTDLDRWAAKPSAWTATHRRTAVVMGPPSSGQVAFPLDASYERVRRRQEHQLARHVSDEPQVRRQTAFLLNAHQQPRAFADPRPSVRERMLHTRGDKGPNLVKPHTEVSPVLAKQVSLNELGPREAAVAGRLASNHWRVLALPSPATFEPPFERAWADSQNLGRVGKGVHPSVQQCHVHTSMMPDHSLKGPCILQWHLARWAPEGAGPYVAVVGEDQAGLLLGHLEPPHLHGARLHRWPARDLLVRVARPTWRHTAQLRPVRRVGQRRLRRTQPLLATPHHTEPAAARP